MLPLHDSGTDIGYHLFFPHLVSQLLLINRNAVRTRLPPLHLRLLLR